MAQLEQVLEREVDAEVVVRRDGRDRGLVGAAVDQHQRDAVLEHIRDDRILALGGRQDQPVHVPRPQSGDDLLRVAHVVVRVREHHHVPGVRERLRNTAHDWREHRIGEVGNEHADGAAAARAQSGGERVRQVAELARDGEHAFCNLAGHHAARFLVEDARDGGSVHPGLCCDFVDGHAGFTHGP